MPPDSLTGRRTPDSRTPTRCSSTCGNRHYAVVFRPCLSSPSAQHKNPTAESVGALFELLRDADARDLAAIKLLLTSRRNPILYEECESFLHNYLELDEGTTGESKAIFSRAVLLFGTTMARLYFDRHFGLDENYNNAFEKLLMDSLSVSPSDTPIDSPAPARPDFRSRFAEGDSLRADLAYSTFRVVGRSGYAGATISRIARRANTIPPQSTSRTTPKRILSLARSSTFSGLNE